MTVSACWSAALTAAQQRRLLGLPVRDDHFPERTPAPVPAHPLPATLATELSARLNCAVPAMHYPVDDDFAIALSRKLYELLAEKGQPLPRAVGIALTQLAAPSAAVHGPTRPTPTT